MVDWSGVTPKAKQALDRLNELAKASPYPNVRERIISAYRSPAENKRAGGASKSQHLHGNAFDFSTGDLSHAERLELASLAHQAGFTGFGFYTNNLHFDVGPARAWGPSFSSNSIPKWASSWVSNNVGKPASVFAESAVHAPPASVGGAFQRTLKQGSKGEDVSALQSTLASLGLYDGPIDGIFGSGTKAAVEAYQKETGLKADGIVGRNTINFIEPTYQDIQQSQLGVDPALDDFGLPYNSAAYTPGQGPPPTRPEPPAYAAMLDYGGSASGMMVPPPTLDTIRPRPRPPSLSMAATPTPMSMDPATASMQMSLVAPPSLPFGIQGEMAAPPPKPTAPTYDQLRSAFGDSFAVDQLREMSMAPPPAMPATKSPEQRALEFAARQYETPTYGAGDFGTSDYYYPPAKGSPSLRVPSPDEIFKANADLQAEFDNKLYEQTLRDAPINMPASQSQGASAFSPNLMPGARLRGYGTTPDQRADLNLAYAQAMQENAFLDRYAAPASRSAVNNASLGELAGRLGDAPPQQTYSESEAARLFGDSVIRESFPPRDNITMGNSPVPFYAPETRAPTLRELSYDPDAFGGWMPSVAGGSTQVNGVQTASDYMAAEAARAAGVNQQREFEQALNKAKSLGIATFNNDDWARGTLSPPAVSSLSGATTNFAPPPPASAASAAPTNWGMGDLAAWGAAGAVGSPYAGLESVYTPIDPITGMAIGSAASAAPTVAPQAPASIPQASTAGATPESIKAMQQELAAAGLYKGAIDGIAGPLTQAAINAANSPARAGAQMMAGGTGGYSTDYYDRAGNHVTYVNPDAKFGTEKHYTTPSGEGRESGGYSKDSTQTGKERVESRGRKG